jgi:hypothetical protein
MKGEMNMSTAKLIRWSGLICILAGMLYALGALLHPVGEDLAAYTSPKWVPAHQVYWFASMLMLLGLVGLYARQVEQTGWLGLVGFILAFLGTVVVNSIFLMASTVLHLVAVQASALFDQAGAPPTFGVLLVVLGYILGYILFGIATMRAGVLPRGSGLLLIIGSAMFMISEALPLTASISHLIVTIGDVIFGAGFVWMGFALWSEKREFISTG